MSQSENELVPAAVFTSDAQANIALGMLRTNGIPCVLDGELAYTVMGIQLSPTDGMRLMVKKKDLALAQKLLSQDDDLDDQI